jgi:hypothetical protein
MFHVKRDLGAKAVLRLRRGAADDSADLGLAGRVMAPRRIGPEMVRFGAKSARQTSLDALHAGRDFAPADLAAAGLYPAAKGEKAWPPLAMFKGLLLATRA